MTIILEAAEKCEHFSLSISTYHNSAFNYVVLKSIPVNHLSLNSYINVEYVQH